MELLLPLLAYGLDLIFGDPAWPPHPVRIIGIGLDRLEAVCRKLPVPLLLSGAACTLGMAGAAGGAVWLLGRVPLLGWLSGLYFAWAGLALGCLLKECGRAAGLIEGADLDAARRAVGMLVSRQTERMDRPELRRTLAETLSENFGDGFAAPFFWLCLGGPAGLWAYKAVSTMDSMWGYRNERFMKLGKFCARTDDVLAWIPARLAALGLLAAGACLGLDAAEGWRAVRRDARKMESPNAGWPMSAAAGLLRARMGGPAVYFGRVKDKPALGPEGEWTPDKLAGLLRLVRWASWPVAAVCLPLTLLF